MKPQIIETTQKSQHGTWIEIRLDRLRANLQTLKNRQLPQTEVMAVIKANAYGHGLLEIARALSQEVSYFGVSCLREALALKEHEISTPVFIFSRLLSHEIPTAVTEGFTLAVSGLDEAEEISETALSFGRVARVHVKVDTGMGRFGLPCDQAAAKIEKIKALEGIETEGLFTHFPTSERQDGFLESQVHHFAFLLESLEKKGIVFRYRHGANSAGSLKVRTPVFNMIRPGLLLYGVYPDASLLPEAAVSPVLSLKTRILFLKRLRANETVGYGRDFVAPKPTTIGILAIGYSHGYPWRASGKSFALYQDKKIPIAGRVSMDYLAVDFGDLSVRVGDEVTLIGEHNGQHVRAEDLAAWADTIPYEILTRLAPHIPRFYR